MARLYCRSCRRPSEHWCTAQGGAFCLECGTGRALRVNHAVLRWCAAARRRHPAVGPLARWGVL